MLFVPLLLIMTIALKLLTYLSQPMSTRVREEIVAKMLAGCAWSKWSQYWQNGIGGDLARYTAIQIVEDRHVIADGWAQDWMTSGKVEVHFNSKNVVAAHLGKPSQNPAIWKFDPLCP